MSARRTALPGTYKPARSGSTATACSIQLRPLAAYKESGFGREMGKDALDLYTQVKTVWVGL